MNPDITRSIVAIMECASRKNQHGKHQLGQDRDVIALSSGTGAGGREVGRILAGGIGVKFYDEEIIEEIARETHLNKNILELLDERIDGLKGAWFHSFLTGENLCKENYCRNLVNVILGLACQGSVILGRGSCFILAQYPVFRVHIVGSLAKCAVRVAAEEDIPLDEAKQRVKEADKARDEYIKKLFNQNNNDPKHFDLVVNSDRLSPEHIADFILRARKGAKFEGNSYPDGSFSIA
uniref:Cytidylate kinase n=1 Tax=Candidatus Kentrum sp. LPFa TaxID=2126335 RepID=A0A450X4N3_9GAMM|nr:MAG: Cytidylate kinase [Candidatus Kentron sp. LPFa]VFK24228.1 MAG: Cytidylate kinase [Candidatus Kentron sp. LPFa]